MESPRWRAVRGSRPKRLQDFARGFVPGDSRGVHAATCPEIIPGEVNTSVLLLKRALPAVPARGGERNAFWPALNFDLAHQSGQVRVDAGQIVQERITYLAIAAINELPGKVARTVRHQAAAGTAGTRSSQDACGVEEQVEGPAGCHHRVDVVPGHSRSLGSEHRGDDVRAVPDGAEPLGCSGRQVLDDLPCHVCGGGYDHVLGRAAPGCAALEPLHLDGSAA